MRAALALLGLGAVGCAAEERSPEDYACTLEVETEERADGQLLQGLLDAAVADGLPGAILLIRQKTGEVWAGASGYADLELGAEMQPCTPMRVGAISQMMASTALLTLVEEGVVGLDQPVSELLLDAEVQEIENIGLVSVRHLLSHTSGIPDYLFTTCAVGFFNDPTTPFEAEDAVRCMASAPAEFQPGLGFGVSNSNYVLIGMLLEAVTGQTPAAVLEARVLSPMSLGDTLLDETGATPPGTARGYGDLTGLGDVYDVTEVSLGYGLLDAGVVSTADDLSVFAETLLIRGFLDTEVLKEMKREVKVDGDGKGYGLGLVLQKDSDWGKAFGHQGIMLGWEGEVWYLPEAKTTVTLLVNGSLGVLHERAVQLSQEELAPLLLSTL